MTYLADHLAVGALASQTRRDAAFTIKSDFGSGTCTAEGALEYELPGGKRLCHKSDILLESESGRYVAIELKFLSSVTDQFKARAFDMLHLKETLGERVCGVMIYVHAARQGIGLKQAEAICYPFDHFLGFDVDLRQLQTQAALEATLGQFFRPLGTQYSVN